MIRQLRDSPYILEFDNDRFEKILRLRFSKKRCPWIQFLNNRKQRAPAYFIPLFNKIVINHIDVRLRLSVSKEYIRNAILDHLLHELGHWWSVSRWAFIWRYEVCMTGALCSLGALGVSLFVGESHPLALNLGGIGAWLVILGVIPLPLSLWQIREQKAIAFCEDIAESPICEEFRACIQIHD